jgi:phosphohistidine phosphatase
MARRLYLLRHAKSSWDDPALDDHDRPLAPRGRKAAGRMARWIEEHELRPELAVCSTAVRARQTLELVLAALGEPEISYEEGLYHGWTDELLARIRALDDTTPSVLLVGHNPALQNLCLLLAAPSPERDRIAVKLPTGALVGLELDAASWTGVEEGRAEIDLLVLPRELA